MKPSYLCSQQKDPLFPRGLRARALGCALLMAGGHAQANVFCVSSASELQNALTDSSDGGMYNGEDNLVYVVQGTYMVGSATGNGPFHYLSTAASGGIAIQGGFGTGCSAPTRKAALTVLDGNHIAQVLTASSSTAYFTLLNFTIQNGESNQGGGGLSVNHNVGDKGAAFIQGNIIRNNHTGAQSGGLYATSGGANSLYVQYNLITGNSADEDFGAGAVVCNSISSAVYNNTVTRNTTTIVGGTGGLYFGGSATYAYVANNIFWNNTNYGLYLSSAVVQMAYNDFGMATGDAPLTSIGDISLNPSFVDAAGGDFHMKGNSPLLGTSPKLFIGVDPDGIQGSASGKADIGAYNETIFIDGFDGN